MIVKYVMTLKADIILDGDMTYHGMNGHHRPLQEYIDKATYLMDEYGFESAAIVDAKTGEIIVEMESDCDGDEPAYYDDGDTCDYE